MTRAATEEKIDHVLMQAKQLPSDNRADRAMRKCLLELLEFCREATFQIDKASSTNKPIRVVVLLEALRDIQEDRSVIDLALCLDPSYDEIRQSLSETIEVFIEFVSSVLGKMPLLIASAQDDTFH